ncbi:MAG: hypothetical protein D6726_10135 [Nitrospirae bacterium]|nr:MAG: hypothetical protein D6726_10135 [Nitrospirota bacterium]
MDYSVELNRLKREVFYSLLNTVGRVFIIVRHSEDVIIGRRGFLEEEKEKGLVLVFNNRMNFRWEDWGIDAKLVFGTRTEHCMIPVENIIGVYSPEAEAQFLCTYTAEKKEEKPSPELDSENQKDDKVVRVDFGRKSR